MPRRQITHTRPAQDTVNARFLTAINVAQQAQPANMIVRPGGAQGEGRILFTKTLSALATMQDFLSFGAELASLVDENGYVTIDPPYRNAGETITVESAMSQSSRVLSAGATLIQGAEIIREASTRHGKVQTRSAVNFSTFEPIEFNKVDFEANPDAELPLSPVPFQTAEVDLDTFEQFGVAFRLSRRELKSVAPDRLAVQILWPLVQGLGRALDAAFFEALGNENLLYWSSSVGHPNYQSGLGYAATQGIPFESLRALVGTSGSGAITDQGLLYAGGVRAELTPDTARTFLGSFNRAAIVTDEDIRIIATRTDASGGLEVACWLGVQALIPDPSKFWVIGNL